MPSELDEKFNELKRYSEDKNTEKLTKRIYDLDLDDTFLSNLSEDALLYIHSRIHNALSYKRPFASFDKLKEAHDKVSVLLTNHQNFDKLDD